MNYVTFLPRVVCGLLSFKVQQWELTWQKNIFKLCHFFIEGDMWCLWELHDLWNKSYFSVLRSRLKQHLIFFTKQTWTEVLNFYIKSLSSSWRLSVMSATFYILWPITNVLVRVENEIWRTRHVMLPFSFTHVVHGAIRFVFVVGNMSIFFFTCHLIRWKNFVLLDSSWNC